mgnify:CR=1 FL=1
MENKKQIAAIRDFIISAEKSIKNAKKLLKDILEDNNLSLDTEASLNTNWLTSYNSWDDKIIEWVFTWEDMLWVDKNSYPVPANYSSKSKLVQWDRLKLTILANGKMMYKQISPIEREFVSWLIVKELDKYQVIAEWKTYDLLTAAVTHFKWSIWDNVTIIIPKWKEATFAAIETIIPKE